MSLILEKLKDLLGEIPKDVGDFRHRMRIHQGWWRMAVLGEEQGENPADNKRNVCNTIGDGDPKRNFISDGSYEAFVQTKKEREKIAAGMFIEKRLLTNLLSSQPLCFNFFGELKFNRPLAAKVLQSWIPDVGIVEWVKFEFAPEANYTNDFSAFDIAICYRNTGGRRGLLGLECKYTDDFSTSGNPKKKEYRQVYEGNRHIFPLEYDEYFGKKYVQLFRNELMAQALLGHHEYDIVTTGLFCHYADEAALSTARAFQSMIGDGQNRFRIITYRDFITSIQQLELEWKEREWIMKLWARYCGVDLSEKLFQHVDA
jgi:hypothetical protein